LLAVTDGCGEVGRAGSGGPEERSVGFVSVCVLREERSFECVGGSAEEKRGEERRDE